MAYIAQQIEATTGLWRGSCLLLVLPLSIPWGLFMIRVCNPLKGCDPKEGVNKVKRGL